MGAPAQRAADLVRTTIDELGLDWSEPRTGLFGVRLPGVARLATDCALEVGDHTVHFRAFVCRQPDGNVSAVHRWLLQRNLKLAQVSFALDDLGDIYLVGRIPLGQLTADAVDQVLGLIATQADECFNPLLELGFADAIRREWQWRLAHGESTANLAAFKKLRLDDP